MKKRITSFLLAVCLVFTLSVPALAAGEVGVSIDGTPVAFDSDTGRPFIDSSGRTLVPLRVTMETYGCKVYWDNENSNAIVYKDGVTVICPIGKNKIVVNGKTVATDTAAVIADSHTYLPIRCVLEAVGAAVEWDGEARTVLVTRGNTDVLLDQDVYITRAMEAIDANIALSGQYTADVKKAVTLYLQNVLVDETQISKMCARLKRVNVVAGALDEEIAGYCSTSDNVNYTITLDTVTDGKIRDSAAYDCTMFHELCHMFSNITQTNKWFQEGMTTMFEKDIAGKKLMDITLYDDYYRVILILTELLGKDLMREAYLTGNESLIYTKLNEYAGVTDSASVLNSNVEKMTSALIGGIFTWMGKSDGKT
ncbi:MAG: copper amine oxidase N-terminal domain-containing protein [Oscillospiraceae bacterium]|nr:copper amine oxidase N-terminal domain-containing protein [Oscillospiraceae bacterium]